MDPRYIGPGVWFVIHVLAKNCQNTEDEKRFLEFMIMLSKNFPCDTCKYELTTYLKNNPLSHIYNFLDSRNAYRTRVGYFYWTYRFHNSVNKKLGKPVLPFDEVYNQYYHLNLGYKGSIQPVILDSKEKDVDNTCTTCSTCVLTNINQNA